jgi:hypothetical protein
MRDPGRNHAQADWTWGLPNANRKMESRFGANPNPWTQGALSIPGTALKNGSILLCKVKRLCDPSPRLVGPSKPLSPYSTVTNAANQHAPPHTMEESSGWCLEPRSSVVERYAASASLCCLPMDHMAGRASCVFLGCTLYELYRGAWRCERRLMKTWTARLCARGDCGAN